MQFIDAIILLLIFAIILSSVRVVAGPTVWDRLLGLSLISSKFIIIIVLFAYKVEKSYYLDIALVFAVLGFVGLTSLSKFLRKDK